MNKPKSPKRIASVGCFLTMLSCIWGLSGCSYMVQMSQHSSTPEQSNTSRTFGAIIEDEAIEAKLLAALRKKDEQSSRTNSLAKSVTVTSYNRVLLLAGKVENQESIEQILAIAETIPHIRQIQNEITLGKEPSLLNDLYDFWLTTKLRSRMIFTRDFPSNKIKVSTAQGIVYLMGIVTDDIANQAIWISRQTSGTRKVVTLFERIPARQEHQPHSTTTLKQGNSNP